jgi:hypothetical protein
MGFGLDHTENNLPHNSTKLWKINENHIVSSFVICKPSINKQAIVHVYGQLPEGIVFKNCWFEVTTIP